MKKLFYLVLALVTIIAAFVLLKPSAIKVESYVVGQSTFDETLAVDGKVRTRNKQTVYAFANGTLQNLLVKVGDAVAKDQVVTALEWDRTLKVKSPMAGVVSKIFRESGGPINRGDPIFEISDLGSFEVVAEVLTPEAVRLRVGGLARIQNWGGDTDLSAKIFQISQAGAVKVSALGVEEERTEVKLKFDKLPSELQNKLGDNYHVDVVFIVSHDEQVLTVPLGALFRSGDRWSVYTIRSDRAQLQNVVVSKRNDRFAVVSDGLVAGDRVILFPGDKISAGSRVEAVFEKK